MIVNYKYLVYGLLLVLTLWYILGFLFPYLFSQLPNNAGSFGDGFGSVSALFNGIGLLAAITAGYLVFVTYEEQRKQVAQDRFYKLLDNYTDNAKNMEVNLDDFIVKLHDLVKDEVR